ncbi:MORN repeat-containing protein [Pseudoduganella namucuonensis]|uniref:Uncharacterized conserved protein n=1 Tax=Pseudoduganella namucuonensis TaxID=1035707 RepID=A0A1I7EVF5_9BURK|nr:hypothetical protein [Pseudoduganella namucuonensis]SFU27897.1 Uncharacterized conserved protein [Pseudoduganella namucuonensis]
MPPPLRSLCALLCAACLSSSAGAADLNALAKRGWIKVDTPNFSVITEQPEATARQVVNDLEALRYFRTEVGGMKALKVSKPLTIIAIGNEDAFAQLGLPKLWAGVFHMELDGYSALANISDYAGEDKTDSWARTTLLHEYFHFMVRLTEKTQAYPRWVDEGMADYWATFNIDGPSVRLGDRVTINGGSRDNDLYSLTGRAAIDTRKIFNTTELALDSDNNNDRYEMGKFYSSAYYAVHYFNSTPALRTALGNYIEMINLGYRQDRAAELAFNKSYEELNKDIIYYVTRRLAVRILTAKTSFNFPKVDPVVTRLDTPGLYANLARILPSYGSFSRKEIQDLLVKNRELNPDDADAQVLPLLHGMASGATIAELGKRFPRHPRLLTLRADLLRWQAEHMKDMGDAGWLPLAREARGHYRGAIGIDRDYPAAYHGLGMVYRLLPAGEPLEEAVAGFDTASIYTRAPETFSHLASALIRMNKPMEALSALRSAVAFSKPPLRDTEALLLDNFELLGDLANDAKTSGAGLEYPSGTLYAGPVANNKPEGVGKMTMPSGSYYEGAFARGLPHGRGKLVSDSGLVYQGEFERGIARGQGEVTFPAGSEAISYKGRVDHMKPSGKGELLTTAGRYVGEFEDGSMHGAGEFTAAKTALTLSGKWLRGGIEWPAADGIVFRGPANADGQRHGKGVCRGTDVREVPGPCQFKNDKPFRGRE